MLEDLVLELFEAAFSVAEKVATTILTRLFQNVIFVKWLHLLTICVVGGITIYIVLAGVRKTIKEGKL